MSLQATQGISATIPAAPIAVVQEPVRQSAGTPAPQAAQSTISAAPQSPSNTAPLQTFGSKLKAWVIWFFTGCGLFEKKNQLFPNVANLNDRFSYIFTEVEGLTHDTSYARAHELRRAMYALKPALNVNDESHTTFRDMVLRRIDRQLNPLIGQEVYLSTSQNIQAMTSDIQRLETEMGELPTDPWERTYNPAVQKRVQQIDDLLKIYNEALCGDKPEVIALKAKCAALQTALEPFVQNYINKLRAEKTLEILNAVGQTAEPEVRNIVNSDYTRRLNRVATDEEFQQLMLQPNAVEQLQPIFQSSNINGLLSAGVIISFLKRNFIPSPQANETFNQNLRTELERVDTRCRDLLKNRLPQGKFWEFQNNNINHHAIATRAKAGLTALIGSTIARENARIQEQRDPSKRMQLIANTILSTQLTSALKAEGQTPNPVKRLIAWIRGTSA